VIHTPKVTNAEDAQVHQTSFVTVRQDLKRKTGIYTMIPAV
jgi:hypothetical protein